MTRHLKSCAAYQASLVPGKGSQVRKKGFFHVFVEGDGAPEFWLHLDVQTKGTLAELDEFLRDIWLECCGHMSAFQIGDRYFEQDTGAVDSMWSMIFGQPAPAESMRARLSSVLRPGLKFFHEYDFGSTTRLILKVISEHEGVSRERVLLLARNELPDMECSECGNPAAWIDTFGDYELYCAACADAMVEESKEGFLPVVNSPRMGVCGYVG
jgi:hypothetical protein